MQPRPQRRRLLTYSSTARSQPPPKTANSQMPQTKLRQTRPIPPPDGKKTGAKPQGVDGTSDADIYDLPSSSDGEEQQLITRAKRRRYGAQSQRTLQDQPGPQKDTAESGSSKSSLGSLQRWDAAGSILKTTKSPTRMSNRRVRSSRGKNEGAQEMWQHEIPPDDEKLPNGSDTNTRQFVRRSIIPSDTGFNSPKNAVAGLKNHTPGRKRIIDSLDVREWSAEGTPSGILADRASSSPITSSPIATQHVESLPPRTPTKSQPEDENRTQDLTAVVSPHIRGSKVTYARQRSFLDDLMIEAGVDAESSESNNQLGFTDPLATYHRNANPSAEARLFTIEEPENDDGTVRSIHELRQAGGNARYCGAVESIFEDIEDPHISVSGRCNALVQLCMKLLDSKLAHQFIECNFDKRLVEFLCKSIDLVPSSLGLCAYALCSLGRPLPFILATSAWPKLANLADALLDIQEDLDTVTRTSQRKISKAAHQSVQNIIPKLRSTLLPDTTTAKLSPCFLILQCLKLTLSAFQEKGEKPASLPVPVLKQLVNIMLSSGLSYEGNKSSAIESDDSRILILGLSILEVHIASGDTLQQEHHNILSSLSALHGLLSDCGNRPASSECHQLQTTYIRLVLNLTNSHSDLCDAFSTPQMINELARIAIANFRDLSLDSRPPNDNSDSLDTVILTLGALINIAEQSEASRLVILGTGDTDQSILSELLQLFLTHVGSISKAHSVTEIHHNVALGYLAVLLLALCLDPNARTRVKKALHPNGLSMILSIVSEFLQYHRKIDQESQSTSAQNEANGFYGRLQGLIGQIQDLER